MFYVFSYIINRHCLKTKHLREAWIEEFELFLRSSFKLCSNFVWTFLQKMFELLFEELWTCSNHAKKKNVLEFIRFLPSFPIFQKNKLSRRSKWVPKMPDSNFLRSVPVHDIRRGFLRLLAAIMRHHASQHEPTSQSANPHWRFSGSGQWKTLWSAWQQWRLRICHQSKWVWNSQCKIHNQKIKLIQCASWTHSLCISCNICSS